MSFFLYVQDGRISPMFLQILVAVASDAIEAVCMPRLLLLPLLTAAGVCTSQF